MYGLWYQLKLKTVQLYMLLKKGEASVDLKIATANFVCRTIRILGILPGCVT